MHLGLQEVVVSLVVFVQKSYLVDREADGAEVLLYLSLQEIRPHLAQHVAEPVIPFREEGRLIDAGGELKDTEGILAELSQVLPA